MNVNPRPSEEEIVRQPTATDKGEMKYNQMQQCNPTLTRILKRRQHPKTGCKAKVP